MKGDLDTNMTKLIKRAETVEFKTREFEESFNNICQIILRLTEVICM